LQGEFDPMKYPAQLVARQGADVTWFLVEHAAGRLD
jgi:hypothetical protein